MGALVRFATATAVDNGAGPVRVVHHVSEGNAQAMNAPRNIGNHLTAYREGSAYLRP